MRFDVRILVVLALGSWRFPGTGVLAQFRAQDPSSDDPGIRPD